MEGGKWWVVQKKFLILIKICYIDLKLTLFHYPLTKDGFLETHSEGERPA